MYNRNNTFRLARPATATDAAAWALEGDPARSWTLKDGLFPEGTDGGDISDGIGGR